MRPSMDVIETCRSCGSSDLQDIIQFGDTPLADRLVKAETLGQPEYFAPLTLTHCNACSLSQIRETVDPAVLFGGDYPYYSSVSPALMRHFAESAEYLIETRGLGPDHLVVEVASNDGYMLENFHKKGIGVLGIDPASGPAAKAVEKGIPTHNTFFTEQYAADLAAQNVRADVMLGNNVLAHVADLNGFVAGLATVLKDDGIIVIECPYLLDLVDHCEFDTIYHQHLCYFSLTALAPLFERHGLVLNHAIRTKIHGGSLRLFVSRESGRSVELEALLAAEAELNVSSASYYDAFVARLETIKTEMHAILKKLQDENKKVVGYGAAAKATTLLHFLGIDKSHLAYIADRSPQKQGWHMPGTNIPIVPPSMIEEERPDCVLILAWNFAKEIMADQKAYAATGGEFVVPIPKPMRIASETQGISL